MARNTNRKNRKLVAITGPSLPPGSMLQTLDVRVEQRRRHDTPCQPLIEKLDRCAPHERMGRGKIALGDLLFHLVPGVHAARATDASNLLDGRLATEPRAAQLEWARGACFSSRAELRSGASRRALSSVGQSRRLITGRSQVRVLEGPLVPVG